MKANSVTIKKPPVIIPLQKPWRITFDTNPDDCNLSCIMCEEFSEFSNLKEIYREKGLPAKRRMSIDLVEQIINDVTIEKGLIEIIPSTMGEPLLYIEFPRILDLCKNKKIKLNLTTNGTFPKRNGIINTSEWAELIVPVTSDIKISWNGFTKETQEKVMKKSDYAKGIKNIQDFIKVRNRIHSEGGNFCRVTLQVTFLETNYNEFPDLVKMASEMGVNRIKGHHLWSHFDEIKQLSMRRDAESIRNWNETVKKMENTVKNYKLNDGSLIKLDNIYVLNPTTSDKTLKSDWICPFLGREAWVAWDGRFNPCCAPDAQRLDLGYFGNLNENTLYEIWNSEKYLDLVNNYYKHPLCQSCNMRRPKEDIH